MLTEVIGRDCPSRRLRHPQQAGRPVKPIERHLVDCLAVIQEMVHGVQVSPLMCPHENLADIEFHRGYRAVRDDRQLGVTGESRLPMHQRMGQVDDLHWPSIAETVPTRI